MRESDREAEIDDETTKAVASCAAGRLRFDDVQALSVPLLILGESRDSRPAGATGRPRARYLKGEQITQSAVRRFRAAAGRVVATGFRPVDLPTWEIILFRPRNPARVSAREALARNPRQIVLSTRICPRVSAGPSRGAVRLFHGAGRQPLVSLAPKQGYRPIVRNVQHRFFSGGLCVTALAIHVGSTHEPLGTSSTYEFFLRRGMSANFRDRPVAACRALEKRTFSEMPYGKQQMLGSVRVSPAIAEFFAPR